MRARLFSYLFVFLTAPIFAADSYKDAEHSITLRSGYEATGSLGSVVLGLDFLFNGHWKTYWRTSGLTGYPIKIDSSGSVNVKSVSINWPVPDQFVILNLKAYGYEKKVVLPLTIALIEPGKEAIVNLKLDYLICDPGNCLQRKVELSLKLSPKDFFGNVTVVKSHDFDLIKSYLERVPHPDNGSGMTIERVELDTSPIESHRLTVVAHNPEGFRSRVSLFIEPNEDMYLEIPEVTLSKDNTIATFTTNMHDNELKMKPPSVVMTGRNMTFTLKEKDKAIESIRVVQASDTGLTGLLLILAFAFIGGFILNFMPCVLPVILIKIYSIFHHGGATKAHVRRNFLLTVMGILSAFWLLAALSIVFKQLGYAVGWGVQFQEPLFLVAIMIVITLFAYNLLGWFEILLSSNVATKLTKIESKESVMAHFFSGAFVTLLATPCTAPFLGTALSYALSRSGVEIFEIFTFMGLGLALPFMLIGIFPGSIKKLPKPGKWMDQFKKSLSILLFATLAWLLWTLSATNGTAAAYTLVFIFGAMGIALYLKYRSVIGSAVTWALILFLSGVSFAVPYYYGTTAYEKDLSGTSWVKFDEEKIAGFVNESKTVFVDVTADWCLTCKANELFVLKTQEVEELLKRDNTVAMVADWTNGDKNITAFLRRFGKYGVPFYVVFSPKHPDGVTLSEVLTVEGVKKALTTTEK